jgi:AcrR family transcriptional regulator
MGRPVLQAVDSPGEQAVPDSVVRERILAAGARLFSEHGYEAVALRQICEEARVSKGAIYHYFASKEDLLSAIVISSLEQLLEHMAQNAQAGRTASDRLRGFIVSQAEFFEVHTAGFRVAMARFASVGDAAAQGQIDALRRAYVRAVRSLFADGIASGEFWDVDVRAATRMVLAILYWLARWYEKGGRATAAEIAAGHADIMLRGVSAK